MILQKHFNNIYHRRFIVLVAFITVFISSCKEDQEVVTGKGGVVYGGEFKFMSFEKVENLFPLSTVDLYAQRLNSQIFETLVKLNLSTLAIEPALCESYEISDDAKTFRFKIRKGVYFHDDPCFGGKGRELTPQDIKYSLEMACSGLSINKMSYLLINRIQGAKSFYQQSKKALPKAGVSGIRLLGKNTIEIRLLQPFEGFLKVLTLTNLGVFPREAYAFYKEKIGRHPVGTGPFSLEKLDEKGAVLSRHLKYWRKDKLGNQLPFIDKISMTYAKDKRSELIAFRKKEIDIVLEIPVEEIEYILGSLKDAQAGKNVIHRVESHPSISTHYIGFACESPEFKDERIRRAFAMAINREELVEKWLLGEGWPSTNGFVPTMDNYNSADVQGVLFNPKEAQRLIAQAGFPSGKGFPQLDFYVNAVRGSAAHNMCKGIVAQLKRNLGIPLKIILCSLEERERAVRSGKAKIWRSGWIADYPDPENFLSLFYGGNKANVVTTINDFRFQNKSFDALYESAQRELDEEKRNRLFVRCDQILVDQSPVIPLFTDDYLVMVNIRVRNFETNEMENLDFSTIFIKEPPQRK